MLFVPAARLHAAVMPFDQAAAYVDAYHRHNEAPVGHIFSMGCYFDGVLVGVAICGRPVARALDNGRTLEVYRVCTRGHQHACSKLYGACQQLARLRGYEKLITYTRESEKASSVIAANFLLVQTGCGGAHWTGGRQVGLASSLTSDELKCRWEIALHPTASAVGLLHAGDLDEPLVPESAKVRAAAASAARILQERDLYEPLVQESPKGNAAFDYVLYPGRAYMHRPGVPVPEYVPAALGTRALPTPEQFTDLHELAYAADQAGFQLILARATPRLPVWLTTCRRGTKHRQSLQWCDTHISARERLNVYFASNFERYQRVQHAARQEAALVEACY